MPDAVSPICQPRGHPGHPRKRPEKLRTPTRTPTSTAAGGRCGSGALFRASVGADSTQANAWDATSG